LFINFDLKVYSSKPTESVLINAIVLVSLTNVVPGILTNGIFYPIAGRAIARMSVKNGTAVLSVVARTTLIAN
jgi:hypothetical protein